jgi:cold-inducible RNA-binding protein
VSVSGSYKFGTSLGLVELLVVSRCGFPPHTSVAVLRSDYRKQPPQDHAKENNIMSSKLYVGNLSFDTTEVDLQDTFAEAGTVSEVALMQDKFTGKSRGFAFVTMSSADEAQKAISLFHGKTVQGRALTVNEARPREERGGGGGGGRRDFGGGGGGGGGGRGGYQKRY